MAFPTTGILDNFNRGNEGPPPSASWTNIVNGLEVIGNQCAGDNVAFNLSHWNVAQYGPDCEAYLTVAVEDVVAGVAARLDVGAGDGYNVVIVSVDDEVIINRQDGGADTQLGAAIGQVIANGDKWGIECVGDQISAYFDDGGAGWGSIGVRTEATYGGAGHVAASVVGQTIRGDDFGGGTYVAPPVGGHMTLWGRYWGP